MIVIDLKDIKLSSINDRFGYNPKTGKLFNNPEYKQFQKTIISELTARKVKPIESPYYVEIFVKTYNDLDNCIKVVLDSLEKHGTIDNDKNVLHLVVNKKELKKGTKSDLQVIVETLKEE